MFKLYFFHTLTSISMAITVVLPAPVASFSANLTRSGLASLLALARCSRKPFPALSFGATSVNQIAVSTTSIWQKNGRIPLKEWYRQYCRSRAVSGVTCQLLEFGMPRHWSTWLRSALIIEVGSYLLLLGREPFPLVENHLLLCRFPFAFSGFRYWRDELCAASGLDDFLCRLAAWV